jgi:hypothetical protein
MMRRVQESLVPLTISPGSVQKPLGSSTISPSSVQVPLASSTRSPIGVQEPLASALTSQIRTLEQLTTANMFLSTGTEDAMQSTADVAQAARTSLSFAHVASATSGSRARTRPTASRINEEPASAQGQTAALELRRNAKEPAPSEQEPSRVETAEKPPEINAEQLQKAISALPQLHPDQLADQVYKSLMKRMKFEQSLRGY